MLKPKRQRHVPVVFFSMLLITLVSCEAATPVPIGTPTPSPTATGTLTKIPASSPSPPLNPRAPLPDAAISYSLQPPDPDQLVALIDMIRKRSDEADLAGDEPGGYASWMEASKVDQAVTADLEHYYPVGLPGGNRFAERIVQGWDSLFHYPSSSIEKILTTSSVRYLNERHIQFIPQKTVATPVFSIMPVSLKIEGEPRPNWLAQVDYPEYHIRAFLSLAVAANGIYHILPNDIPVFDDTDNTTLELDATHDLNGDGNDDVVIASRIYLAGGMSGRLSVYSGNGTSLLRIGGVDLPGVNPRYGETYSSTYTIADRPGRPAEIHVLWPRFRSFGCDWTTVYTYRWVGAEFMESSVNNGVPDKPDCYIAKALESNRSRDQAFWLQSALTRIKPGNATSDLRAWVLLRLAVAYSAQGDEADAESTLKSLVGAPGAGGFLKAVINAYSRVGPAPLAVCKALYMTASDLARSDSSFNSTIDGNLAFDFAYPISPGPVPDVVCPYWALLKNQIKARQIAGGSDPVRALAARGYQLEMLQTRNLDSDPAMEYIGVLQGEKPLIVVVDPVTAGWQIYPIDFVDRRVVSLDATVTQAANRVEPQTLLLARTDTSTRRETTECMKDTQDYQLFLSTGEKGGYELLKWRGLSCQIQSPVDLQTEGGKNKFISLVNECNHCDLIDDYYAEQPDWIELRGLADKPQPDIDVFGYINLLDQDVLQGHNLSQTRTKIAHLIDFLPGNVAAARILRNHLSYLHALTYESDGKPALAVKEYLALIQEAPDSLWSWLAWSRLTPNPIRTP
jgi:hypothetical protein